MLGFNSYITIKSTFQDLIILDAVCSLRIYSSLWVAILFPGIATLRGCCKTIFLNFLYSSSPTVFLMCEKCWLFIRFPYKGWYVVLYLCIFYLSRENLQTVRISTVNFGTPMWSAIPCFSASSAFIYQSLLPLRKTNLSK